MKNSEPPGLIEIVAMGRGSRDEWTGMLYEVRSPHGYNFGSALHLYIECGKAAALEMRRMLERGELEPCEADCGCCWSGD